MADSTKPSLLVCFNALNIFRNASEFLRELIIFNELITAIFKHFNIIYIIYITFKYHKFLSKIPFNLA